MSLVIECSSFRDSILTASLTERFTASHVSRLQGLENQVYFVVIRIAMTIGFGLC